MKLQVEHVAGVKTGLKQSFDLSPNGLRSVRVGRGLDNDIVFDPHRDIAASTYHAEIECRIGSTLYLRDLGSSNGTRVAGVVVKERQLRSGDIAEFGHEGPKLRFVFEEASAQAELPATEEMARHRSLAPKT